MKKQTRDTEIQMEVLSLLQEKVPYGVPISDDAWNFAYEMVRMKHLADSMIWKKDNLTIGIWR